MIIQVTSLYFVDLANTQNAMLLVGEALDTSARSLDKQIKVRNDALTHAGRILSADFAFKTAFASTSTATISSALDNHQRRIGANLILLLSLEGMVITGSGRNIHQFRDDQGQFVFRDFFTRANSRGEASALVTFNNAIYSMIAVPLLTPVPSAWIVLGFQIDEAFIQQLKEDSHADISIVSVSNGDWESQLSTLGPAIRGELLDSLSHDKPVTGSTMAMTLGNTGYFSFVSELPSSGTAEIYAVLQRDSEDALSPYYRLRLILLGLLVAAVMVSIVAGGAIASSVSRPVQTLVKLARQIQAGKYKNEIRLEQRDEIGQLALAFNDMSRGLYERDKVRNLLGKVMSPQIAEELISKDLALGGEEREITILFTDLRDFTSFSESRSPAEVLTILNEYLTRMTVIIDQYGGVVDKYIGDAIMALFGAPLDLPDHGEKAVRCAIDMSVALQELNAEFKARGWPELNMGIGINTGNVVVGNMGSRDRLNYTVIGDNVNLASRLESITKDYGVPIIVSKSTRDLSPAIQFTALGKIHVKGKTREVTIYTPVI